MAVKAIRETYSGPVLDAEANFHGNRIVYIGWDRHLMYATPGALPLPPAMPFAKLLEDVLPQAYGLHPDFPKIQWDKVQWLLDGEAFEPAMQASLAENGIGHKSVVRFVTPELTGIAGCGI